MSDTNITQRIETAIAESAAEQGWPARLKAADRTEYGLFAAALRDLTESVYELAPGQIHAWLRPAGGPTAWTIEVRL